MHIHAKVMTYHAIIYVYIYIYIYMYVSTHTCETGDICTNFTYKSYLDMYVCIHTKTWECNIYFTYTSMVLYIRMYVLILYTYIYLYI